MSAWVPHSVSATSRSCGPPPWVTPNSRALAGVSAASSPVPSQATSRSPNANAPGVPGAASGPRHKPNSSSKGRCPSRCRALVSAELVGSTTPGRSRSPLVSHRITDRYPGGPMLSAPLNRHNPSTKYITVRAGSRRRRFSRHPASSITRSTSSGPISPVSTPSPTTPGGSPDPRPAWPKARPPVFRRWQAAAQA